jgi:uncharacterized protein (TIGR04255 family)
MSKLPKAPLQEAIFEVRWELDIEPSNNQQLDMGFALAQGKLQEIVKGRFPIHRRKLPHGIPDQLLQYQAVNQYWSKSETWPVLQLGPGIFTVNDTELTYDWPKTYFPLIQEAFDWILKAYDGNIRINSTALRYIDSVKLKDYGYEGHWQEFIQEHFNFSFVNSYNSRGPISGIHFDQTFLLEEGSSLQITMNSGKHRKTDEDALIWQTAVTKNDKFKKDSLLSWVEKSHEVTSSLFKEMTKPSFYGSFK